MKQVNNTGTKDKFEGYWWGVLTAEQQAVSCVDTLLDTWSLTWHNSYMIKRQLALLPVIQFPIVPTLDPVIPSKSVLHVLFQLLFTCSQCFIFYHSHALCIFANLNQNTLCQCSCYSISHSCSGSPLPILVLPFKIPQSQWLCSSSQYSCSLQHSSALMDLFEFVVFIIDAPLHNRAEPVGNQCV